jgi:putative DNA primase/helicase
LLEHNGDFARAAKELANMGFSGNGKPQHNHRKIIEKQISTNSELPPLSQIGNAQRFKMIFKDQLKFNHTTKEWLIWDGIRWRADTKDNIRLLGKSISDTIERDEPIYVAAGYGPKAVRAWHKSSQTLRNIDDSLKLAACEPEFATSISDWDRDPYLLNFKNGTLDLREIKFYKNRPEDMITKLVPFEYDPKATSALWENALNMYFDGNQELIEFVQKACGLSLCGAHLEEIIIFLYGTGANGKSIFVNTLQTVFGDYAGLLPIEALITQRFDDIKKSEIASLVGSRLVVTTEIPVGKHLNEATVKALTGGDAVRVRNLYQNFFTFQPSFTLWIFGNHKPDIRGADNGIWRRMALIPFEKTIPQEKRLPQSVILEKLKLEAPGIITWIVDGWRKYSTEGLKRPEAVVAATESYKEDQDPLSGFFLDRIVISSDAKEKGQDLYQAYLKWCEDQKESPIGKKVFFRILEEKGFSISKDRKGQKIFFGLSLSESTQNIILQQIEEHCDEYEEPF